MLAPALGFWGNFTTSAGGATTDLVCSTLIDSDLESSWADGVWSIITSTTSGQALLGQVRRVRSGGLAPATGTLTHTRAFSSSVSTNTAVESTRTSWDP